MNHNDRRHGATYHGLRNQGSTCYLNSVLQVLFMTKEFRKAVNRCSANNDYIDPLLKHLFKTLERSTSKTSGITNKLGITVNEQHDAAEYFEKILNATSPEASQIFQGQLTHKNTCTCDQATTTSDPFWSLPLRLESNNKDYNVEKGIENFFQDLHIFGENQMYCEHCDAKTDATITVKITHHPEVLTLLLKRFKFDYQCQEYVKIKQEVTVSDTLKIPESHIYELYAFVDHFGELRSGHYTVTIKSQDDGRWYNFNDSSVTLLSYHPFQLDRNHKSSSAYLLFYRKQKTNRFHGLINQGATCYLNSVLQVLFMTKDFREAVTRNPREAQSIDHHLMTLFDDLNKYPASTYNITSKLGINKVYVQSDAAECFEKILSLTSSEVSQIFQGVLTHKNKCCECGTETGTDDPFWTLPLELVKSDKNECSVEDAIEKYFSELVASGPDQLYCDNCNNKSDAAVKTEMTNHPDVLTLLLKRFKFDYRYHEYIKIKQTVTVPDTLQMPESHIYELYAFVEHFGEMRSGHYTVTIKSQDDEKWYNFNDSSVTLLSYQPFQLDRNHKSSSAYLLFYKKNKMHAAEPLNKGTSEDSTGVAPNNEQCEQAVKSGKSEEGDKAGDVDPQHVDIRENDKVMNDREDKDGETGFGKQADEMQDKMLGNLKPEKHNLSKNNQDQKKEEKNKRDDQQAQRQNGTKRHFGESENQILDDSQSRVEEEQGQKVRHTGGEKTGENRHDRRRDQCSVTQTLPGSKELIENQRRSSDCKKIKLHVQSKSEVTELDKLCSVQEDMMGGISLAKEDQTINIQSSSKTQVRAKEVNKLRTSVNKLRLIDPPSQEPSEHNNPSEKKKQFLMKVNRNTKIMNKHSVIFHRRSKSI